MADEEFHVSLAFAKRRQVDREHIDAVVKIFAKAAGGDLDAQVAVGGGDEADVDAAFFDRTDAAERAVFEHAEEFGLQAAGEVAEFIDEQRAAVGDFEQARFAGRGAR